jgi:cytochrome c peroxidase
MEMSSHTWASLALCAATTLTAASLATTGCAGPPPPTLGQSLTRFPEDAFPYPADNQPTPERIELGRLLFFDPILSQNRRVACGSCHLPERALADSRHLGAALAQAQGGVLPRSTPTIFNVRFQHSQFWDGRADSLESLALMPVENALEMGSSREVAVRDVAAIPQYGDLFRAAYGTEIDEHALQRAIASFLRSVTANSAPVDRYLAGDERALSAEATAGFDLFFGKARCSRCHYLPLFAGTEGPSFVATEFRITGVPERGQTLLTRDLGRGGVSGLPDVDAAELRHAFKAPTLRNIDKTAPYMHNGAFDTLEQVIDFYDRGPEARGYSVPNLDFVLQPGSLGLTSDEKRQILTFLREGLTDLSHVPGVPSSVPSGLVPGGFPPTIE